MPTLIVWGDHDRVIPVDHAYAAHELMPGSRLEILPGAGHFLPFEQPDWFNGVLCDFLATTEPAELERHQPARAAGRRLTPGLGALGHSRTSAPTLTILARAGLGGAAVDLEGDAVDELGRLGAEEGDDLAEVGGVAHACDVSAPAPASCFMRSVACGPGAAMLRVMPSGKRSAAAVLAHAHSPVRAVFERASVGMGCFTDDDVMQQMRPQPLARMWGTASRTSRTDVSRLALRAAASCLVVDVEGPARRRAAGVGHEDVDAARPLDGGGDQRRPAWPGR